MLVNFLRLRNKKEPLVKTQAVCPLCGKPLYLLRHSVYLELFSLFPIKTLRRGESLICLACGCQQESNHAKDE